MENPPSRGSPGRTAATSEVKPHSRGVRSSLGQSGSLAMLTAIRRASSRVSNLAAARRLRFSSK